MQSHHLRARTFLGEPSLIPTSLRVGEGLGGEGITLLYSDAGLTRLALFGIAQLAANGNTISVLDGANSFDAYFVARLARHWQCAPETILARIRLSRAFTCFQMAELIARCCATPMSLRAVFPQGGLRSAKQSPQLSHGDCFVASFGSAQDAPRNDRVAIFCLGLLETFFDEDVPLADAMRLLKSAIAQLADLARRGSRIIITLREPREEIGARIVLCNSLKAAADRIVHIEGASEQTGRGEKQLSLPCPIAPLPLC